MDVQFIIEIVNNEKKLELGTYKYMCVHIIEILLLI